MAIANIKGELKWKKIVGEKIFLQERKEDE